VKSPENELTTLGLELIVQARENAACIALINLMALVIIEI
jgi:hypothetical protein